MLSCEVALQLDDIPDGIDRRSFGERGLGSVFCWNIQGCEPSRLAAKAIDSIPVQGRSCPERDNSPIKAHFSLSGGKIDGDPTDREGEAAVLDGGTHSLSGLVDSGIGQTHHCESGQSAGQVALGSHQIAGDALKT